METNNLNFKYNSVVELDENAASRKFLGNVFSWMFVAMVISGITTYLFTTHLSFLELIVNTETGGLTAFGYFAIFSPIAFSLVMNYGFNKMSYQLLILLFVAYAAIIGISLSLIFLVYTSSSILMVFLSGTAIFGVMAIAGYTTQQDLSAFGPMLRYAVIGLIIASIANFFIGGSQLSYVIGFIGAAVFTGLTAYYMQMLKRIGAGVEFGTAEANKLAIMGALGLYVTLINLILSLLRIFGRRR